MKPPLPLARTEPSRALPKATARQPFRNAAPLSPEALRRLVPGLVRAAVAAEMKRYLKKQSNP